MLISTPFLNPLLLSFPLFLLPIWNLQPKVHPSLAALSSTKALLLPHVGTLTLETQTEMEAVCINNLIHGLEKGRLSFVVNEQKGIL